MHRNEGPVRLPHHHGWPRCDDDVRVLRGSPGAVHRDRGGCRGVCMTLCGGAYTISFTCQVSICPITETLGAHAACFRVPKEAAPTSALGRRRHCGATHALQLFAIVQSLTCQRASYLSNTAHMVAVKVDNHDCGATHLW